LSLDLPRVFRGRFQIPEMGWSPPWQTVRGCTGAVWVLPEFNAILEFGKNKAVRLMKR